MFGAPAAGAYRRLSKFPGPRLYVLSGPARVRSSLPARAVEHGEARVLGEALVGARPLAHREGAAAPVTDDPLVTAGVAEAGVRLTHQAHYRSAPLTRLDEPLERGAFGVEEMWIQFQAPLCDEWNSISEVRFVDGCGKGLYERVSPEPSKSTEER
jgi:hypothetical protein